LSDYFRFLLFILMCYEKLLLLIKGIVSLEISLKWQVGDAKLSNFAKNPIKIEQYLWK